MKGRNRGTWLVAVGLGIGLAVGLVAQAWAQYPPPGGNVEMTAADTTPVVGDEVAVTATVRDEAGVAAAGVDCTFSIAQQPGDDASVVAGPFTTDNAGNVSTTLDTGSTAGTIVVAVACGELSAQVSVVAGAVAVAAPTATEAPAAPPGALPTTGSGGEGGGTGWALWTLIAAGVAVGLGGLALAWRRAKA